MQNAADLYRFETDSTVGPGRGSVMLIALGGFIDAGHTQRLLNDHLLAGDAEVVASFDVDQLLDYRGRRPMMVFEKNAWVSYDDPAILLQRLTDRDGQPYYLLTGPEPDYQWERFIEAVREVMATLGISLVVTAHGIPMAVPHTRPLGMSAHGTDPRLVGEHPPIFARVQVPASVTALLELRLGEHGQAALGFAIHVPHYLTQTEYPEAALTALNAIVDATGLNLPNDDLVAAAGANRAAIAAEVAGSEDVAQVVHALEQQYDAYLEGQQRPSLLATEATELPSADQLGAEFEEFLRSVDDSGDGGEAPR